jgi:hypothetical protein
MSEPGFERIEHLFQAAADLPNDQRTEFLTRECHGDGDLQSQVQRLLDRFDARQSLTSPMGDAARSGHEAVTEGPGATIDRYKLLQVIGEGGFGVVYMAEQQEPVVRKVALKIIKLGMDTREVVARFEAERQALAMMDHPHIAKVLDGGATASGRPYFVMELVRGVAITQYADHNDLDTTARLQLFLLVCSAIQHAHHKGVIHRDIKPSNVLVTLHDGRPMPKVIDFGIAKAMHARLTDKTLFTRFEQFVGTPAYMSPEQAEMSALDVDTRTDIYSLGVLLYELLTGSTPFDTTSLQRAGLAEIQRIIREEQPPRPSLRISTAGDAVNAGHRGLDVAGLSRALRGDLDWIVMRALEKDRGRRYATANELGEDVSRHLRREAVAAGPPGAGYRVRKFLHRNRTAVVSVSMIALALIMGIIGTTYAMLQAKRNADAASNQAARAMTALEFLLSTLSLANPEVALNPDVTVQTLLDHTASRVQDTFGDDPWAEVRVRTTIGRAYTRLSQLSLAETHLRRAVEIVDDLAERGQAPGVNSSGFDKYEHYVLMWTLTNVCFNLERSDAFAVAGRARTIGLNTLAIEHRELSAELGQLTAAIEKGAWSLETAAMSGVQPLFEQADHRATEVLTAGDRNWAIVADTFLTCGYMVWYTPHEPFAETFWTRALEIQRRELPPDHPDIATTINLLVGIWTEPEETKQAEQLIRESIDALRRVHRDGAIALVVAEGWLGEILSRQGRFEEAETTLIKSHGDLLVTLKDQSHWLVLESFVRIVRLYDAWERPAEAAPYRDAVARTAATGRTVLAWKVMRTAFGPKHKTIQEFGDRIEEMCGGLAYLATSGVADPAGITPAVTAFTQERDALLAPDDPKSAATARVLLLWANALQPASHLEARHLMAQAAQHTLVDWSEYIPQDAAESWAQLGSVARARGQQDQARHCALKAWQLAQHPRIHSGLWFHASTDVRIARVLLAEGMFEPVEMLLKPAHDLLSVQLGPDHGDTVEARRLLYQLYTVWGRPDQARAYVALEAS